jgi:tellurite resistance protein TerC
MGWLDRIAARLPGARRIALAVAGFSVLAVGVALLVLPGPGLLVIAIGFAILAREFAWAARLVTWFQSLVGRVRAALQARRGGRAAGISSAL